MAPLNKGLLLTGLFASQTVDKSGEILDIKGVDISSLEKGTAVANFEHQSNNPDSIVGRIISARKLFTINDCKTDLERRLFKEGGSVPAIAGTVELIEDHPNAEALGKTIQHFKKRGLPTPCGFSIEGATLERDGNLLKRSVARSVAITFKPCNAAAKADVISELSKSEAAIIERMEKSDPGHVIGYSTVPPQFIDAKAAVASFNELHQELTGLLKSLEAGFGLGPVGSLTQGAALQKPASALEQSDMKDVNPKKLDALEEKADEVSVKSKKAKILAHLVKKSVAQKIKK